MNPSRALVLAALAAAALAAPQLVHPLFAVKALCFVLAACGFQLLLGGTGLLSLGHAAFFGGAAYFCGHLLTAWSWPLYLAVPAAVAATAAMAGAFASLSIRRQGLYFSMITLALAQFAYFVFSQVPFTGGDNGLQGVPRGSLLGLSLASDHHLYWVVLAVVAGSLWLMDRISRSSFGFSMQLVRNNESRALSLGYDVTSIKWRAFVISAAFAALAGAIKVVAVQFATLTDVHFEMSGDLLMMAVIGGIGSLWGAALGALLVLCLHEYFATLGSWVQAIQGALFAIVILFFPGGLAGAVRAVHAFLVRHASRMTAPSQRPPGDIDEDFAN